MMSKNKIDFDYILSHYEKSNHEIPYSFDKIKWKIGDTYKIRISYIYDPSKFWIVHYEQELTLFHKFINNFYNKRGEEYRMPKETIKRDIYCTVLIEGFYYRSIIVNIPLFTSRELKIVVFLLDFGVNYVVSSNDVFYLYEKMYNVQRFAIRACLHGIEPYDTDTWTSEATNQFHKIVMGKVLLSVLECQNPDLKVVYIRIAEVTALNQVKEVGLTLLEEKIARVPSRRRIKNSKNEKKKCTSNIKYPFLFPSHQAIENGKVPSTCYVAELIKQCTLAGSLLFNLTDIKSPEF